MFKSQLDVNIFFLSCINGLIAKHTVSLFLSLCLTHIHRGEAYSLGIKDQSRPVTVKMLAQQAPEESKIMLYQDIEMLTEINHLNVVGVLAVCTQDTPECILLDAGMPGDLLTYIRDKKNDTSLMPSEKGTLELLNIADEVSLGMTYLASERFIHKDLALRNCIIGYDGVVKIAHFGLGPLIYPEAYYRANDSDLPIRWMPPETITSANFTTSSDIWAYGVLLWELFTYGDLPFRDKSDEEVITYIVKDLGKLSKPTKCPNSVYVLMQRCWDLDSYARPSFIAIHEEIGKLTGQKQSGASTGTPSLPPASPTGLSSGSGMDLGFPDFEVETSFK